MRLKFWKKTDAELEITTLKAEVLKLRTVAYLKDELYMTKYIEFEQFKKSAYATLGAIALAHGGEYFLDANFTAVVLDESQNRKLNINNTDEGTTITLVTEEEPKVLELPEEGE